MYKDWYSTKSMTTSRKGFAKAHILTNPCDIVGLDVAKGLERDLPMFHKIFAKFPNGNGVVLLDGAYDAKENCEMIVNSGRVPVIIVRENTNPEGYNARAKMCEWARERPDKYQKVSGTPSLVESIFSSMRSRTSAFVRVRLPRIKPVEIFAKALCYLKAVRQACHE